LAAYEASKTVSVEPTTTVGKKEEPSAPDRRAMAAAAAAAAAARSQPPSRQISAEEKSFPVAVTAVPAVDLSRSGIGEKVGQQIGGGKESEAKVVKVKVRRKVSFTEKEPVVIDSEEADEVRRRRGKKDKEGKKKRRDRSQDYAIKEERRKSQPLGEELFEQVSSKLRAIEKEREAAARRQEAETEVSLPLPPMEAKAMPRLPQLNDGGAFGDSPSSSKGATSSESSPPQKPRGGHRSGANGGGSGLLSGVDASYAAGFAFGHGATAGATAATGGSGGAIASQSLSSVRLRERKPSAGDSRSSSKRSSLDGKTVAGLAQDLAAECAKAFALMENSLSKLSNDFGVSGKVRKAIKIHRNLIRPSRHGHLILMFLKC